MYGNVGIAPLLFNVDTGCCWSA